MSKLSVIKEFWDFLKVRKSRSGFLAANIAYEQ